VEEEAMTAERTLAIIKPDAVGKNLVGKIIAHLEGAGFVIRELQMTQLGQDEARRFYEVHSERPFYESLVAFMTSGRCVPMVLERHSAVSALRETIGHDPRAARDGPCLYASPREERDPRIGLPENAARSISSRPEVREHADDTAEV
jgi:nucleoside-diphosphate kinase